VSTEEGSWTIGSITVAVDNPTDPTVLEAAFNLGEDLGTSVSVVRKDAAEMPASRIVLWTDHPDHPAMQQLAQRLTEQLDMPVLFRPLEETTE